MVYYLTTSIRCYLVNIVTGYSPIQRNIDYNNTPGNSCNVVAASARISFIIDLKLDNTYRLNSDTKYSLKIPRTPCAQNPQYILHAHVHTNHMINTRYYNSLKQVHVSVHSDTVGNMLDVKE